MSDDAEPNPTVARRRLAVRLSRLREEYGRSLDDLATFLGVALPQASRLDSGARGFPSKQVAQLADWYGLPDPDRAELLELAAESRRRAWWQQIPLEDSYRTLIGMERAAQGINEFGNNAVPGLLQTREYARAAVAGTMTGNPASDEIEQAVEVRMRRQLILDRARPPTLHVVIDEVVLARTTGGPRVMDGQLAHLEAMSDRPGMGVRIVGFERGLYTGSLMSHFILVALGGELPDVLYQDNIEKATDTSDSKLVGEYKRAWDQLSVIALDPYESRARIRYYRSRLAD